MSEIEKYPGLDNTPVNMGGGCEGLMSAVTAPFEKE